MKALTIVALLLGLGAVGASGFAKVETHPNYQSLKADLAASGPSTPYDVPLLEPYFRIASDRAERILDEVDRVVGTWRAEGRAIGMTSIELDQFADAFEHTERRG